MSTIFIVSTVIALFLLLSVAVFEYRKRKTIQDHEDWLSNDYGRDEKKPLRNWEIDADGLDGDIFDSGDETFGENSHNDLNVSPTEFKDENEGSIVQLDKQVEQTIVEPDLEEIGMVNHVPQQQVDLLGDQIDEKSKNVKLEPIVIEKEESFKSVHSTVIILTVMTKGDDMFEGADLLREFNSQNLLIAKDGFFHRPVPGLRTHNVFSVANVLTPGIFDPNEMLDLRTKGLLMFMKLPNKLTPVQSFEQFYDTADSLAVNLGGEICDQNRNKISTYRLEQMRDDMRHLSMKLDIEAKQRKNKR